jgi:hypothetical protein
MTCYALDFKSVEFQKVNVHELNCDDAIGSRLSTLVQMFSREAFQHMCGDM